MPQTAKQAHEGWGIAAFSRAGLVSPEYLKRIRRLAAAYTNF